MASVGETGGVYGGFGRGSGPELSAARPRGLERSMTDGLRLKQPGAPLPPRTTASRERALPIPGTRLRGPRKSTAATKVTVSMIGPLFGGNSPREGCENVPSVLPAPSPDRKYSKEFTLLFTRSESDCGPNLRVKLPPAAAAVKRARAPGAPMPGLGRTGRLPSGGLRNSRIPRRRKTQ